MKNIREFYRKKQAEEKISMVTCYDYTSAKILNQTDVDCVLVGDSLAMVMHGAPDTTHATIDMMCLHTQAVARGLTQKFLIGDLPFLSYRQDLTTCMQAVMRLIQAGADAIKLEGAAGNLDNIQHIVESGVPVMGHIGLTPQHVRSMGWRVQGRDDKARDQLLNDAKALEQAGCFALVLECIPSDLAQAITESIGIATIGIGAGVNTDGQVLVWQDMLGMNTNFKPKFIKHFLNGEQLLQNSLNAYVQEVVQQDFPASEHIY